MATSPAPEKLPLTTVESTERRYLAMKVSPDVKEALQPGTLITLATLRTKPNILPSKALVTTINVEKGQTLNEELAKQLYAKSYGEISDDQRYFIVTLETILAQKGVRPNLLIPGDQMKFYFLTGTFEKIPASGSGKTGFLLLEKPKEIATKNADAREALIKQLEKEGLLYNALVAFRNDPSPKTFKGEPSFKNRVAYLKENPEMLDRINDLLPAGQKKLDETRPNLAYTGTSDQNIAYLKAYLALKREEVGIGVEGEGEVEEGAPVRIPPLAPAEAAPMISAEQAPAPPGEQVPTPPAEEVQVPSEEGVEPEEPAPAESPEAPSLSLEEDWKRIEANFNTLKAYYPEITITVKKAGPAVDRPKGSKIIRIENKLTKEHATLELIVPRGLKSYHGENFNKIKIRQIISRYVRNFRTTGFQMEWQEKSLPLPPVPEGESKGVEELVKRYVDTLRMPDAFTLEAYMNLKKLKRFNKLPLEDQLHYLKLVSYGNEIYMRQWKDLGLEGRKQEAKNLNTYIQELREWHAKLSEKYAELSEKYVNDDSKTSELFELKTQLDDVKSSFNNMQTELDELAREPDEVAPAFPDSLQVQLAKAENALGFGNWETPKHMQEALSYSEIYLQEQFDIFLTTLPEDLQAYLNYSALRPRFQIPKLDGSTTWWVEFNTLDDSHIVVTVKTPPVSPELVNNYVQAQAALGKQYPNALVAQYAGSLKQKLTFRANLDANLRNLNKAYENYTKSQKKRKTPVEVDEIRPTKPWSIAAEDAPLVTPSEMAENVVDKSEQITHQINILKTSTPNLWFKRGAVHLSDSEGRKVQRYWKGTDYGTLDGLLKLLKPDISEDKALIDKINTLKTFQKELAPIFDGLGSVEVFASEIIKPNIWIEQPDIAVQIAQCDDLIKKIRALISKSEFSVMTTDEAYKDLLSDEHREFVGEFYSEGNPWLIEVEAKKAILKRYLGPSEATID